MDEGGTVSQCQLSGGATWPGHAQSLPAPLPFPRGRYPRRGAAVSEEDFLRQRTADRAEEGLAVRFRPRHFRQRCAECEPRCPAAAAAFLRVLVAAPRERRRLRGLVFGACPQPQAFVEPGPPQQCGRWSSFEPLRRLPVATSAPTSPRDRVRAGGSGPDQEGPWWADEPAALPARDPGRCQTSRSGWSHLARSRPQGRKLVVRALTCLSSHQFHQAGK